MSFPISRRSTVMNRSAQPDYPYSLGPRLYGWWVNDARDVTLNGSLITQVNDRGPGGWHATQANPLAQLEYDELTFGVGAAIGSGGQSMGIPAGFAATLSADRWFLWAVIATDDETITQCFISAGDVTAGSTGYELTCDAAGHAEWGVRVPPVGVVEDGAADTSPHLLMVWRDGLLGFAVDGVVVSLSAPNAAVVAPVGASRLWAITAAAWHLVGVGAEVGVSDMLTGAASVGNPVTGEMARIKDYVSQRYSF